MPSLFASDALLPNGWARDVLVEWDDNGKITRVAPSAEAASATRAAGPLLPGMPNVHSHAFQRAMAGLTEHTGGAAGDDFWTWREAMYRSVDLLGPDDVEAIAALAFAEMLETGFTRVGEFHYLHHDPAGRPYADPAELATRIIAAAVSTGIGLTLLPAFYAHANLVRVRRQSVGCDNSSDHGCVIQHRKRRVTDRHWMDCDFTWRRRHRDTPPEQRCTVPAVALRARAHRQRGRWTASASFAGAARRIHHYQP